MSTEITIQPTVHRPSVFLTDLNAIEADDTCGMKYWLANHEGGRGILQKDSYLASAIENQLHADLRDISKMDNPTPPNLYHLVNEITDALTDAERKDISKMELLYRRLGLAIAFALFEEPHIRRHYETLDIDASVVLDRDPLWVIVHPDRILRDRLTDEIIYRRYAFQPSGYFHRNWLNSWAYNIELHAGIAAVTEELADEGKHVDYGQIVGMGMGYNSIIDNRLIHPYVWAFRNESTGEWKHSTLGGEQKEWKATPVWEFPGGLVNWITKCGEGTAKSLFRLSSPVFLNKDILDNWTARRLHRERTIKTIRQVSRYNIHVRNLNFERRTSQCRPAHGEECPYIKVCWSKTGSQYPIESNEFMENPYSMSTEGSVS